MAISESQADSGQIDLESYGGIGLADPARTLAPQTHLRHCNRTPWNHLSSKYPLAKSLGFAALTITLNRVEQPGDLW